MELLLSMVIAAIQFIEQERCSRIGCHGFLLVLLVDNSTGRLVNQ